MATDWEFYKDSKLNWDQEITERINRKILILSLFVIQLNYVESLSYVMCHDVVENWFSAILTSAIFSMAYKTILDTQKIF